MARFAVLFMVIFLLFTFCHAHFLTAEPEHGVATGETTTNLPESDPRTTTTIFLPSERAGFEPTAKIVDFKHDDASKIDSDVVYAPLTRISFRPVNRHFPRRPLVPFRHKYNCRFHKRFRHLNPRFQQKRYISYGDDMILSGKRVRFYPESRGVVRQIQARWARFPDGSAESKEHVDFMKPHHHDHDHDHDDDQHHHHLHEEEDERDKEEEHEHEGGFMKRLSKFFIHF